METWNMEHGNANAKKHFDRQLAESAAVYRKSLDRIADKYSRLQHEDWAMEVDMNSTSTNMLARHMRWAKLKMNKLPSKSMVDFGEGSLEASDITGNSQLTDQSYNGDADASTSQLSGECNETSTSDASLVTVHSFKENMPNLSETELQPEDQDEELELTLRKQSRSIMDLYPGMVSRIRGAWDRHNASVAADSVLRRYRRLRRHSDRSTLNVTFDMMERGDSNPGNISNVGEKHSVGYQSGIGSPMSMATNVRALQRRQPSPKTHRGSPRRQPHQPILVMDLSDQIKPKEASLNRTFITSELPQLGEQTFTCSRSPSRHYHPTVGVSLGAPVSKRPSLSAPAEQATGFSTHAPEDRSNIYCSPVRQSPFKERVLNNRSKSPPALYKSPKDSFVRIFSEVAPGLGSLSTSLSSPQRPAVSLRMSYLEDSKLSLHSGIHSPQLATIGRPRLRRCLSFDSAQPSNPALNSPKKVNEEFMKLYHKFVCQSKSSLFDRRPCRLCARCPESNGSHSSSSLAALVLSPYHSVTRKRHKESGHEGHPQFKRSRDMCWAPSPGSKRYGNYVLRRNLSQSEFPCYGLGSPNEYSRCNKIDTDGRSVDAHKGTWRRRDLPGPANAHQEPWRRRNQPGSSTTFSTDGNSPESTAHDYYSPRKWR